MADRKDLAEKQPVQVVNQRGEILDGEIVKVGRTLVTIGWTAHRPEQFRIDTQHYNGQSYGRGLRFYTMLQVELAARKAAALTTLKAHGFMPAVSGRREVPLEKLEGIAAMLELNWPTTQEAAHA